MTIALHKFVLCACVQAKWVVHAGLLWQAASEVWAGHMTQRDYVTVISKLLKLRWGEVDCAPHEKVCAEAKQSAQGVISPALTKECGSSHQLRSSF